MCFLAINTVNIVMCVFCGGKVFCHQSIPLNFMRGNAIVCLLGMFEVNIHVFSGASLNSRRIRATVYVTGGACPYISTTKHGLMYMYWRSYLFFTVIYF